MKLKDHKSKILTMLMVWIAPDSYYAFHVLETETKVDGRVIKMYKSEFSDKFYAEVSSKYGYFTTEL